MPTESTTSPGPGPRRGRILGAVLIAGIVGLLAGYALSASGIGQLNPGGGSQLGGGVAVTSSIFACGSPCFQSTFDLGLTGCATSANSFTVTAGTTSTKTLTLDYTGGTTCGVGSWTEEFELSASTTTVPVCSPTCDANFTVASDVSGSYSSATGGVDSVTFASCSTGTPCVLDVDLYVVYASASAPDLSQVSLAVSGNL
jgi:hypothetical protein